MENKIIKQIKIMIFYIIFIKVLIWSIPAFDGNLLPKNQIIGISIEPGIGYISGSTQEIVYPQFDSVNPYLSELIWECKNVIISGGCLSINYNNILFLNGGIWLALNKGSGQMNDYDWFYNNLKEWTHWSNHDIFLEKSFFYDINGSFAFIHSNSFFISAILGFAQNYYYWTDKPNNYVYTSSITENSVYTEGTSPLRDEEGTFYVDSGISYEVLYSVPYLGIGIKYANSYIILNALVNYTFLGWAEDHDYHILRSLHFYDNYNNSSILSTGLNVKINLLKHYYLSIICIFENVFETNGTTTINSDFSTSSVQYTDTAGFQNFSTQLAVSMGFTF